LSFNWNVNWFNVGHLTNITIVEGGGDGVKVKQWGERENMSKERKNGFQNAGMKFIIHYNGERE
jgi:hypothetical protein